MKTPRGGHRRPPSFREFVVEVRCWSEMNGHSSFKLELRSCSFKFEISSNISAAKKPEISKKSFQNPPKSSLGVSKIESGASKIEPGALRDAIFKRHLT